MVYTTMKKQHEQQWRCKLPPVFRSLIPRAVLWVVQLVRSHRAPRCEGALQRTDRGEQSSHHPGNDRERTEGGPAPYLAPGPASARRPCSYPIRPDFPHPFIWWGGAVTAGLSSEENKLTCGRAAHRPLTPRG